MNKNNPVNSVMAVFDMNNSDNPNTSLLIPETKKCINILMEQGNVNSFAISMEASKIWVIFKVHCVSEMFKSILNFPIFPYAEVSFNEISWENSAEA